MAAPNLDDPDYARFAWGRYKRLMAGMAGLALLVTIGGLVVLKAWLGTVPLHMAIATALGTFFAVMLTAALMGLVFLSSGTGHDEVVRDQHEEDR